MAQTPGMLGFTSLKQCVMHNDIPFCRSNMTQASFEFFDRFVSYKLMPCLPTDFVYAGEQSVNGYTIVKSTMPAGGGRDYIFRLVFVNTPGGMKIDIPATFQVGFGEKWRDKIALSEQLFLMMRQNMGNKLTCDMINDLIKPQNAKN